MQVIEAEEKELQSQALTVVQQASIIRIVDQSTYDDAAKLLTEAIKPMRARWKTYWDPLRDSAYKSYQGILGKFKEADAPLETAEKQLKAEINRWDDEQERIRQKQQREAQEEAERLEREQKLIEAVEAEQAGAPEEQIKAILEAPPSAVAPLLAPTYERASGITKRENWKARVIDIKKLCKAVAEGKVSAEYVLPNDSALNARARADKLTLNIPGVQVYNDPIISGRGSR